MGFLCAWSKVVCYLLGVGLELGGLLPVGCGAGARYLLGVCLELGGPLPSLLIECVNNYMEHCFCQNID